MTATARRDATGARADLSPQFRLDHAKRLMRMAEAGTKVNPEELRRARELLRLVWEAA